MSLHVMTLEAGRGLRPAALAEAGRRRVRTVLLVEDDEALRELTGEMLGELSFTVVSARSAEEGLRLCREHAAGIDLLVTDLMLPAMDGRQLADRVRQVIPGIPVLLTSGYDPSVAAPAGDRGMGVLQKPYTQDMLERTLRLLLDNR